MNILKQIKENSYLVELIYNWQFIFPHELNKFTQPYSINNKEVIIKVKPSVILEINSNMLSNCISAFFAERFIVKIIPGEF